MKNNITKVELADGCIIAFLDEDTEETRIGISDSRNEDDMFYCSVEELEMNIKAIKKVFNK